MPKLTLATDAHYLQNAFTLVQLAAAAYADRPAADSAFRKTVFTDATVFSDDDTETFGFITVNEDNLVIAFRGTDRLRNWLTNLDFGVQKGLGGKIHDGFAKALDAVWTQIVGHIGDMRDNRQTIWLSGHSLGGALACLAARKLVAGLVPFAACTFGQPRVGDTAFADGYSRTLYRFVNNKDIVPTVPPRFVPLIPPVFYTHVGDLQFFDKKGDLVRGEESDEELGAFPEIATALGSLADGEAKARALILDGLKDHSIENYVRLIGKNLPADE
jgi:triacylglycerol lipase